MSNKVTALVLSRIFGGPVLKTVALYMADAASHDGTGIWMSKGTMAADLELGVSTVHRAVDALLAGKLIFEAGRKPCKNGFTIDYTIDMAAVAALPLVRPPLPEREATPPAAGAHPCQSGRGTPPRAGDKPSFEPSLNHNGTLPPSEDLFSLQVIEGGRKEDPEKGRKKDPEVATALAKPDPFDRFWAAYPSGPRKTDKPKARAIFAAIVAGRQKGIPKTDPEAIIAGAQAYAATQPGEYLKMPTGWLAGERWAAQVATALPQGPCQSDLDLAMGFAEELRGQNFNALPHHLWNKLQHVEFVAEKLKAAGMPLPWGKAARERAAAQA